MLFDLGRVVFGVAILGSVLNSAYGSHVLTTLTGLGAPAAVARAADQSVVAGVITAAHFPPALRSAASEAVRQAFMTGIHRGTFVAAMATAVAALVALAFMPARAVATEQSLSRTDRPDSRARQVTASRA